jgi:hypothetical protein
MTTMPYRTTARPLPRFLPPAPRPRPETHAHARAPWDRPPPAVATGARTAHGHLGPCAVCQQALLAGDRVADLPGGGSVHVAGCVAKAAR